MTDAASTRLDVRMDTTEHEVIRSILLATGLLLNASLLQQPAAQAH